MTFEGQEFPMEPGVYRITCASGYYIGSSVDLRARRITHESRFARKGSKSSTKLYQELRKSGWAQWSIIATCRSVKEARKLEKRLIEKNIEDPRCLNSSKAVAIACPKPISITWNGKVYRSKSECERESAYSIKAIDKAIKQGFLSDADIAENNYQVKANAMKKEHGGYVWNGQVYTSLEKAAEESSYGRTMIRRYYAYGFRSDYDIDMANTVTWNGRIFKDLHGAVKESGMRYQTLCKWYNNGARSNEEVDMMRAESQAKPKKGKEVEWNGKHYPSVAAAYKEWDNPKGICVAMFGKYISRGAVSDDTIVLKKRGRKKQ
jgi:predicted GIY-YIG superfamily endonuclease